MNTKTTFGLRLEQLEDLFSVAVDASDVDEPADHDRVIAELLANQLNWRFPNHCFLLDSLLLVMGRLGCDVKALAGRTLLETLLCPQTDLGLLQAIRDHCKRVSMSIASSPEGSAATTLYYAAIASSVVYHNKRLTEHGYDVLEESFSSLMRKPWLGSELRGLFSQACDLCRGKGENKQDRPESSNSK